MIGKEIKKEPEKKWEDTGGDKGACKWLRMKISEGGGREGVKGVKAKQKK